MTAYIYRDHASQGEIDDIDPALVDLHRRQDTLKNNDELSASARVQLCDQMSGILEETHSDAEREMATDILLVLMRQAQRDLKMALADRLSIIENIPLRLVLRFVHDDIEVAEPVLRHSKVLNDLDLMYIIQSFGSSHWQSIAARDDLNETIIDTLGDKRDVLTLHVLAENDKITIPAYTMNILTDMALTDEGFSRPLLARHDLPEDVVRKLYLYVGQELKKQIEAKFDKSFLDMIDDVDDVVSEFAVMSEKRFVPTPTMLRAARAFAQQGKLTVHLMVETAKRGQISSFVAQFSQFTNYAVGDVVEMLEQSGGRAFARMARAAGFERHDFLSIYMMTRQAGRAERNTAASDVDEALGWFDRAEV